MAAKVPAMEKTAMRIPVTLMPARREASTLPPRAKMFRPKVVRRRTKSVPTRATRKSSTASGRPLYWLKIAAAPKANTARTPVRSTSSAIGRKGTPAAWRRRESKKEPTKYAPTATTARA